MTTTRQCVVYRCYDANDRLIYVGASSSMERRLICHRTQAWWYGLVFRITYELHEDMDAAFAAESAAIIAERPAFNLAQRRGRPSSKPVPLSAADAQVCRDWHAARGSSGGLPLPYRWVLYPERFAPPAGIRTAA